MMEDAVGTSNSRNQQLKLGRKPIQKRHEAAYIEAFIEWHSRAYRSRYRVINRPDPPDAIIGTGRRTSWIEVGGVYWNSAWARDQWSYATPGEKYHPINPGVHTNMDEQFAEAFVHVLKDKITKDTYRPLFEQFGPGYLILPMMSPFFDGNTVSLMRHKWAANGVISRGYFRSVFLSFARGTAFKRWKLKD